MKKTIISIAAAALCASALSVTAFAEDILTDKSVYAPDRDQIAKSVGSEEWSGKVISVDPNTIMPIYYIDFLDYARTGNFDFIPFAKKDGRDNIGETFVSDALNANGEFAGTIRFAVGGEHPGIRVFTSSTNKANSLAFEPNARRISALMKKQNISSDCKEVKLVFVNRIGQVYYIDNGKSKYLAAMNGKASGRLFNDENGGIIEIGDDLKAIADQMLAECEEYKRGARQTCSR